MRRAERHAGRWKHISDYGPASTKPYDMDASFMSFARVNY
jgi:hypothetical protein